MARDEGTAVTGASPSKPRDPYWWMHPAFRGEQTLEPGDSGVMAEGEMLWVSHGQPPSREADAGALPAGGGPYENLAKLLFKVNNYRPGPVTGWYVVVCVEKDRRWAVGQLRADATQPVQVFEDLVFDSEQEARARAQTLRAAEPGTTREPAGKP